MASFFSWWRNNQPLRVMRWITPSKSLSSFTPRKYDSTSIYRIISASRWKGCSARLGHTGLRMSSGDSSPDWHIVCYMKRNSKHTRWGAVLKWPQGPSQDPSPCAVTRGWGLGWTDTGSPEKYTIICPILAWYFNKGFNKWGTWFCFSNVPTPTSLELH